MVVYLIVPCVPSIPSSSVSLTVMARLVSSWPDVRKVLRIFENGVGFIRLSGCIIPKKADKLPSVDVASTGCIRAQPVASVCKGEDGGHWWDGYWGIGFALGGCWG